MNSASFSDKAFTEINGLASWSPRLLCNQADFALTVAGDFRLALNKAVAHILPLNLCVRSELRKHRIMFVGSSVELADLGLTKWEEQWR